MLAYCYLVKNLSQNTTSLSSSPAKVTNIKLKVQIPNERRVKGMLCSYNETIGQILDRTKVKYPSAKDCQVVVNDDGVEYSLGDTIGDIFERDSRVGLLILVRPGDPNRKH